VVLKSALHLRNLIEDLTNMRYLHLGTVDLSREPVAVVTLLRAVYNDLQALAAAKNHALTVELPSTALHILADRVKLGMALTNILNNAIKYTPEGGNIRLSAEPRGAEVWIRVQDDGLGLARDQIDRIFEEFYQVADHMTRQHNGMGIGLAIARGMVAAHGGRLWAESDGPGRGSTFTAALPVYAE
jgi:signal transduction histidine kinase